MMGCRARPDPGKRRACFARMEREIPSLVRRRGDAPKKLLLTDAGGGHLVAESPER